MYYSFIILTLPIITLADTDPQADTTQILLLEDINIQLEATQAINDMYNFQFERAEMQFRWIKQKYPHHPLSYFLLALSEWWKINVNIDNTQYDEKFEAYLDTAISKAEGMYNIPQFKIESAFFQAAGWAFKGRLYAERKKWGKAASAARSSLKYLNDLNSGNEGSDIYREFLEGMSSQYQEALPSGIIVRDFIAGMTDEYFLSQCQRHLIPQMGDSAF